MTDTKGQNENTGQVETTGTAFVSSQRRKLIKGVAIAAPVMMTVASRPVLGAQCTPSAWVSGNLSDTGKEHVSCGGKTPYYWMKHPREWIGFKAGNCEEHEYLDSIKGKTPKHAFGKTDGKCKEGTRFHRAEGGMFPGSEYRGKSMMYVLKYDNSPDGLARHCVAALLNAASIPDFGISQKEVLNIYKQLVSTGRYKPAVGDPISRYEMIEFFKNTYSS